MAGKAVGFYWTLPVPWAGFTDLPADIGAAAAASRTIRYQRELVQRYCKDERLSLIHEQAFMELEPDRGSALIGGPLHRVLKLCREENAALVMVEFRAVQRWRAHRALDDILEESGVRTRLLHPEPLMIDGRSFDPADHFDTWRTRQEAWSAEKPARKAELIARARPLHAEGMSYHEIAERLTGEGLRSPTGKPLTGEMLRKLLSGADEG